MRRVLVNFFAAFSFCLAGACLQGDALLPFMFFGIIGTAIQCLRKPTKYETHNVIHVPGKEPTE